ncbi:hypothetical protein SAMN05216436_101152 [bacterium A37T11]|nr:hypothetical protein SAMN05216436_101152 [bacterium A37T11]
MSNFFHKTTMELAISNIHHKFVANIFSYAVTNSTLAQ